MHLPKLDDLPKLDERGVTLQIVIITAVITLAGAIFSVFLWRIFGTQAENTPGERVESQIL